MPIHLNMVLIRPVFGEPRIDQATPATSGGTNSGSMLAAAMKPLHGVLVRTTIQENASPITTAISGAAAAGDQRIDQRLADIRIAEHGDEIVRCDSRARRSRPPPDWCR